jgi:hypothetical protein
MLRQDMSGLDILLGSAKRPSVPLGRRVAGKLFERELPEAFEVRYPLIEEVNDG